MNPVDLMVLSCDSVSTLEECILAARKACSEYQGRSRIRVWDDNSSDESPNLAERMGCNVVRAPQRRGFPRSANEAIQGSDAPWILLMNADVLLGEDSLDPLLSCLNQDRVLAASPLSLLRDTKTLDMGRCTGRMERGWFRLHQDLWDRGTTGTLYASGGYMAIRRDIFLSLGGFDPIFSPGYWEDVDFCYRAWKRGWRTLFQPLSSVLHCKGQTFNVLYPKATLDELKARNRFLFMWMNLSRPFLLQHLSWLPWKLAKAAVMRKKGFLRAFYGAGMLLSAALPRRSRESSHWQLNDREIRNLLDPGSRT